ncbi:hypothetical protein LINGRAHAP2_LOCUS24111, partial [Linum grandiflorum]
MKHTNRTQLHLHFLQYEGSRHQAIRSWSPQNYDKTMASDGASSSASGGCKTVYCNHNRACVVNISGTGKNP